MQQFGTPEEQRFDEEKQRRIIALAAEFQKEEAASLSRSELEEVAAEAGIDPRYVRKAVEHLETAERKMPPLDRNLPVINPAVLLGSLTMVNVYGAAEVLKGAIPNWLFYLVFGFSLVTGALLSRSRHERLLTLGLAFTSTLLVYVWFMFCSYIGMGGSVDDKSRFLFNYMGVQLVVILVGHALGALIRLCQPYVKIGKQETTG
ncbi:MAG: hypothetical protein ACAH95_17335 [Fimbriimonas sp.]